MAFRTKRARASHPPTVPQLSCELCHERKVKCDKLEPCTNCKNAGVSCNPVHRKRLPRGRHVRNASTDQDLRERVQRLEAMIASLDSNGTLSAPVSSTQLSDLVPHVPPGGLGRLEDSSDLLSILQPLGDMLMNGTPQASPKTATHFAIPRRKRADDDSKGKYMGTNFWRDLVNNVHGLREVIDQPSDEEDDDDEDCYGKSNSTDQQSRDAISSSLFGVGSRNTRRKSSTFSESLSIQSDSRIGEQLCQIFLLQVDPIIKILHQPSLRRFMIDGTSYLGYDSGDHVVEALRSAVCYAAVSSMTEEQCHNMFAVPQSALVGEYKEACEAAIERSGLVISDDITVLQAFILYLVATRSTNQSRAVWTLLSIAVRIAQALSLNLDDHHRSETIYEQQMRRRIWYTICLLDVHASFDRASKPLIPADCPQPHLPANVNDHDFDVGSTGELADRDGITDITKSLILFHAQAHGKALNFGVIKDPALSSWEARQRVADHFEAVTVQFLSNCDPGTSPYAWYTVQGARSTVAAMRLHVLRPMHVDASCGVPPRSVFGQGYLLELAAALLTNERRTRADPRAEGFRWFRMVHYYPLAVALAECYACTDLALIRKHWPIIEASFEQDANNIADYRDGALWRPMQRLMRKTREHLQSLLTPLNGINKVQTLSSGVSTPLRPDLAPLSTIGSSGGFPPHCMGPASLPLSMHPPLMPMLQDLSMGDSAEISPSSTIPSPNRIWYSHDPAMSLQDESGHVTTMGNPEAIILDPAWRAWESFVNDLSFDDVAGAGFPGSVFHRSVPPDGVFTSQPTLSHGLDLLK